MLFSKKKKKKERSFDRKNAVKKNPWEQLSGRKSLNCS
jgi:hypothetical protein